MPPKISVLMSVYNGARYLPEAVESVLDQTLPDFEFIIVNDGCTDSSSSILKHYARQDSRIKLIASNRNKGLTQALNLGLQEVTGNYVVRHDADDVCLPHRLEEQAVYLDENPDVDLVGGRVAIIDEGGFLRPAFPMTYTDLTLRWALFFRNPLFHSTIAFRTSLLNVVEGYDADYPYSQDFDFLWRVSNSSTLRILDRLVLLWRRHNESISVVCANQQAACNLQIVRRNLSVLLKHNPAEVGSDNVIQDLLCGSEPESIDKAYQFFWDCLAEFCRQHQLDQGAMNEIQRLMAEQAVREGFGFLFTGNPIAGLRRFGLSLRWSKWATLKSLFKSLSFALKCLLFRVRRVRKKTRRLDGKQSMGRFTSSRTPVSSDG